MTSIPHPDVTAYAQYEPLPSEELSAIREHLRDCGACRDLVLFIRELNTTLRYEGRVSRVANALHMTIEALEDEIRMQTSVGDLLKRPPQSPVSMNLAATHPLSPLKK